MSYPCITLLALSTFLLPSARLHEAGPSVHRVETARGEIGYRLHLSAAPVRGRAILSPGFFRGPETMGHLAAALAAEGIETVVIAPRRSRPWAGNHAENARDMIALREALGWEQVTYAGFSAGALSALLAASEDPACAKLLMLDPVESGTVGLAAAPRVRVPALALLGKPGPANAWRNSTPMLQEIPQVKTIEFPEARHFDFEARPSRPSRPSCSAFAITRSDSVRERLFGVAINWMAPSTARLRATLH